MFCISYDGTTFHHDVYSTIEAASLIAREECKKLNIGTYYVGRVRTSTPPEDYWSCEDWIEHVSCQDDYGDEEWDVSTQAERNELNTIVRGILRDWLNEYNNRPNYVTIVDIQELTI